MRGGWRVEGGVLGGAPRPSVSSAVHSPSYTLPLEYVQVPRPSHLRREGVKMSTQGMSRWCGEEVGVGWARTGPR